MAEAFGFVLVVFLVGLGAPLVLYLFIRDETDERRTRSRDDAEAYARDRAAERYGGSERDRDQD
jgi:hypothetical protein